MKTIVSFLFLFSITMNAQDTPQNTVDVTGIGIVTVVPDQANITVRNESTGKDAALVKQENDRVIGNVLSFLREMKINDKDVKTEYVRLNKNYDYNSKTYNYAANQTISIRLKDLDKYESLINGLISTGINRIDGVSFSSSNKEALESEARKKAIANAKMKAEEYAGVLNQTIGKAITISEFSFQSSTPYPKNRMVMGAMADSSQEPQTLATGEMEVRATVNVSFLLD